MNLGAEAVLSSSLKYWWRSYFQKIQMFQLPFEYGSKFNFTQPTDLYVNYLNLLYSGFIKHNRYDLKSCFLLGKTLILLESLVP